MQFRSQIFTRFPLLYNVAQYFGHADFVVKIFRQINQATRHRVTENFDLLAKLLKTRMLQIVNFHNDIKNKLENWMNYKLYVLDVKFNSLITQRQIEEFCAFWELKPELRFKSIYFEQVFTSNIESINKFVLSLLSTHQINQDKQLLFDILSIKCYSGRLNPIDLKPVYISHLNASQIWLKPYYKFANIFELDNMKGVKISKDLDFKTVYMRYYPNWLNWRITADNLEFSQKVTNIKTFITFAQTPTSKEFDKFYQNLQSRFPNLKQLTVKFFGEQSVKNISLILDILSKDYVAEVDYHGNFSTEIVYDTEGFKA